MSSAPSVSVVLATRDRIALAHQAVDAILAQAYPGDVDVTVVFDQSEPDEAFVHDAPGRRVRVVANDRAPGLAGARNAGIARATGDLVAFCDDDDTWLPHKLAAQTALLTERPDLEMVVTGMTVVYGDDETDRVWPRDEITVHDLARSRVQDAHPSSILVRRGALADIGAIDEDLPGSYGEDRDLMLRAARRAPIGVVRRPLVRILWHRDGSFFSQKWATIADAIDHLVAKHPEIRADRRGMARLTGRKAFALAALGDLAGARRAALVALRHSPTDARALVALVASARLVTPERALSLAHARGRGI